MPDATISTALTRIPAKANLLVIEAKTKWNRRTSERDHEKLAALTASGEYHYQLGIALCFTESFADTTKTIKEYHTGVPRK